MQFEGSASMHVTPFATTPSAGQAPPEQVSSASHRSVAARHTVPLVERAQPVVSVSVEVLEPHVPLARHVCVVTLRVRVPLVLQTLA